MESQKKLRAATYIRVSTMEQATAGYSLEAQQEKLNGYARYQNYKLLPPYADEGFSGASLSRPALQKLIGDVKDGKIDIVLIYKLDRLSRRVRDVIDLVDLFAKHHVTLYSLTENLDVSSPFGRAALKMSATFSELERETIRDRMMMGKDQRVKQGKALPTRVAPFGYRYDLSAKRFEIIPEEAEIVRKLFDLYASGAYNFRQLHDYARAHWNHPYFGERNPLSCKPIIHRIMYAGYIIYKGELYKGTNFDAIIDYQTYLRAQEVVKRHLTQRQSPNSPYLLTGLLVCAKCGNRYVGKLYDRNVTRKNGTKTAKYKYRAYGCAARVKRDKKYSPVSCDNDIFPADKLDEIIEKRVKKLKFTQFVAGENLVDPLLEENAELKKRAEKLLDLYLDNGLTKEEYLSRRDQLEKKMVRNEKLIQENTSLPARPASTIDNLKDRIAVYDTLDRVEKQNLLHCLIDRIAVNGAQITVKWRVK